MHRCFKLFVTVSAGLALCLFPVRPSRACGPTLYSDDTRFSLFDPATAGASSLEPFYYSERWLNDDDNSKAVFSDRLRNVQEWICHCSSRVKAEDVYDLLYNTTPTQVSQAVQSGNWDSLATNAFVTWLRQPAHRVELEYLLLSKASEQYTVFTDNDPWSHPLPGTAAESKHADLAAEAATRCSKATGKFLRSRYAFQAIRLWFYLPKYNGSGPAYADSMLRFHHRHLEGEKTVLNGWSCLYIGQSRKSGAEAAPYLAKAFHRSEEKKLPAYQWMSLETLQKALDSNGSKAIREPLLAMLALRTPGRALSQLRGLQAAFPRSPYLPMLIGREVNKLENWLWAKPITGFNPVVRLPWRWHQDDVNAERDTSERYFFNKAYRSDQKYLTEVRGFLHQTTERRNGASPYLLLAGAHLSNLEKDFTAAQAYAARAAKRIPLTDTALRIQHTVEATIPLLHSPEILKASGKSELMLAITQLEALRIPPAGKKEFDWENRAHRAKNSFTLDNLLALAAHQYRERGDRVRAHLLMVKSGAVVNQYGLGGAEYYPESHSDFSYADIAYLDAYGTPADVDALLRLKAKTDKNPFERWLQPQKWPPNDLYLDLKGTLLFRQGRYAEAEIVFGKMDSTFWQNHLSYRDYLKTSPVWTAGTLMPVPDTGLRRYPRASKFLIVQDMNRLRKSLDTARMPGVRAGILYRMATAEYNTSYWGKDWMMFSYGNSVRELEFDDWSGNYQWAYFHFRPQGNPYTHRYYRCSTAVTLYNQALKAATLACDDELAARVLLMLAHCDKYAETDRGLQKLIAPRRKHSDEEPESISPYFAQFARYRHTFLFKEAVLYCPDVAGALEKR